MPYRTLNADRIEATLETLHQRIQERFPNRGLANLCKQLLDIAREDKRKLSWVARPNIWLRTGVGIAIAIGAAGLIWFATALPNLPVENDASNVLQGVDAAVNTIALSGAASWFLLNLESRWRRRAVLSDLHELRSIAHVVDMHQLTKDPTQLWKGYSSTASSQVHDMTEFELIRYLDYCSEMLSLTGKLAALYMQNMRDPVIIEAVNEIEDLTTSLSRKIWQKIMILQQPAKAWGQ
ncbi:MAG: hypothetical protein B7Y90_01765 [Alphaproteobacteria bacterium 32-64-14]|nr:MAG: hypothetical protein B7Y90_01765 [Alphaproteobacteria bacterium 32-64-14]